MGGKKQNQVLNNVTKQENVVPIIQLKLPQVPAQ